MMLSYDVIISYTRKNFRSIVDPLHKLLLAYGFTIFLDDIADRDTPINSELVSQSKIVIICISSFYLQRKLSDKRLETFLTPVTQNKRKVVPVGIRLSKKELELSVPSLIDEEVLHIDYKVIGIAVFVIKQLKPKLSEKFGVIQCLEFKGGRIKEFFQNTIYDKLSWTLDGTKFSSHISNFIALFKDTCDLRKKSPLDTMKLLEVSREIKEQLKTLKDIGVSVFVERIFRQGLMVIKLIITDKKVSTIFIKDDYLEKKEELPELFFDDDIEIVDSDYEVIKKNEEEYERRVKAEKEAKEDLINNEVILIKDFRIFMKYNSDEFDRKTEPLKEYNRLFPDRPQLPVKPNPYKKYLEMDDEEIIKIIYSFKHS